ncbi:X8 domain [Dillenia turbinata]|uniref:X8 domain n=1 Tax=Dillenia turbinata TaxID=194707 RepID=A0AAN8Z943_9MAGN
MAVLMYLVFFLALTGYSSATYCICKDGISDTALQKTLDYACGAGADCSAILQNGACYNPNTVKDHCSYAVNSYFQKKNQSGGTCDFSGTATTSASPPSDVASTCTYPSSATSASTPPSTGTTPSTSTITPTGSTSSTTPPSSVYSGISPTGITDTNSGAANLFQKPILIFPVTLLTSGLVLLWG